MERSAPAVLSLATAALLAAPALAGAATITVSTAQDVVAPDGACSLREATITAAANATLSSGPGECAAGQTSEDRIVLPAGTFLLAVPRTTADENASREGDLDLSGAVVVEGAGQTATVIDGALTDRVVDVGPGASARMSDLTITGGLAPAGADGPDVERNFADAVVTDQAPDGAPGGGLRNRGSLTLVRVTVRGNSAGAGGAGGSALSRAAGGNAFAGQGGRGGPGGGIWTSGPLVVTDSLIAGNRSGKGGVGGSATGGDGADVGGTGTGGPGGDASGGPGGSGGQGGGLAVAGLGSRAALTVENSRISGNTAGDGGLGGGATAGMGGSGGLGTGANGLATPGTPADGGSGGGVDVNSAPTRLSAVLVDGNTGVDGGGVRAAFSAVEIVNSTVTGNSARAAAGISMLGTGQTRVVRFSTLRGNASAFGHSALGGAMTVAGSIIDGTCGFGVADGGGNLNLVSTSAEVCPGSGSALGATTGVLTGNGGLFPTLPPVAGSAAIDHAGNSPSCPTTDARGAARPVGGGCDAGAVEVAPPTATTGTPQSAAPTNAVLAGTARTFGLTGRAEFEFGPTTAYGRTVTADLTRTANPVAVTAVADGLSPGTTYHYRLVVTTPDGVARGADATFATPGGLAATAVPGGGAPSPATTGRTDRTAPELQGLTLAPVRFAVTPRRASARRPKPRIGSAFRFRLSEAATVDVTIVRVVRGIRRKGRCVVRPARVRGERCERLVTAGRLRLAGTAGANTIPFSGRIGGKALRPADYRVTVTATDATGNDSPPVRAGFTVVR